MNVLLTANWRNDMIAEAFHGTDHRLWVLDLEDEFYQTNKHRREEGVKHYFRSERVDAMITRCASPSGQELYSLDILHQNEHLDGIISIFSPFFANESTTSYYRDLTIREWAIERGIRYLGNTEDVIGTTTDKGKFKEFCHANHIPTPKGSLISSYTEAVECVKELGYPVIVKHVSSAGGVGNQVIRDPDTFSNGSYDGPLLIEKYCEGIELSVEVLCLENQARAITCIYKGFTSEEHPARRTKIAPAPLLPQAIRSIQTLAEQIAVLVGVTGVCDIDFILTAEGPLVLEVNPRPSGSTRVGYWATGINIFKEMLCMLRGEWRRETVKPFNHHVALCPVLQTLSLNDIRDLLQMPGVVQVVQHGVGIKYPDSNPRIFVVGETRDELISNLGAVSMSIILRDSASDLIAQFAEQKEFDVLYVHEV